VTISASSVLSDKVVIKRGKKKHANNAPFDRLKEQERQLKVTRDNQVLKVVPDLAVAQSKQGALGIVQ